MFSGVTHSSLSTSNNNSLREEIFVEITQIASSTLFSYFSSSWPIIKSRLSLANCKSVVAVFKFISAVSSELLVFEISISQFSFIFSKFASELHNCSSDSLISPEVYLFFFDSKSA